jgi:hypothetical protein
MDFFKKLNSKQKLGKYKQRTYKLQLKIYNLF